MLLEAINAPKIIEKLRQAKLLQVEINKTELLLNQAKTALTALGIKPSNLTKLVAQIKASTTPLENTFFKNTAGVLSIVPSVVSAMLDTSVREILAPLIPRDITSAGFEVAKKASVVAIGKDVVKYGMKKADYDAIVKRITDATVQLRYYVYSTDGYLLKTDQIEGTYEEIVDTSKVIIEFKIFDVSDNIINDSSFKSDIMGQIEPTIRKVIAAGNYDTDIISIEDGNRKVAKFISLGVRQIPELNNAWKHFGGSHIKFSSASRLVNVQEAFFIDFDIKLRDTSYGIENVQRDGWGYQQGHGDYTIPVMNIESLFFMYFNSKNVSGSNTRNISLHAGSGWNKLTVDGIEKDKWYNIRYDFWYDSANNAYRKMMVVTDLSTQQKKIARNEASSVVNDITAKWFWVGDSSPDGANVSFGDEVLIDNFQMKSIPDFSDPAITKIFDPQIVPQKTALVSSNKNFKMTENSFSWSSIASAESFYTGRKYFEITNVVDNPNGLIVGLIPADMNYNLVDFYPGKFSGSCGFYANRAKGPLGFYHQSDSALILPVPVNHFASCPIAVQGDVIRVAVSFDNDAGGYSAVHIGVNGNWYRYGGVVSDANMNLGDSYGFHGYFPRNTPMKICVAIKGSTQEVKLNVGQEPFVYNPPPKYIAWGKQGVI